jgi:hypothetical protein
MIMTRVAKKVDPQAKDNSKLSLSGEINGDVDERGIFLYSHRYGADKAKVRALIKWLEYWIEEVE